MGHEMAEGRWWMQRTQYHGQSEIEGGGGIGLQFAQQPCLHVGVELAFQIGVQPWVPHGLGCRDHSAAGPATQHRDRKEEQSCGR